MQHGCSPGRPFPLGVTLEADGANVAIFSAHAERMELCLFDAAGQRELARLPLPEVTDQVFHGFFPGLQAGQVYGLRAYGPWAPERGHRFNPAKLLLDPYARVLTGGFEWSGPNLVDPDAPFGLDPRDSAAFVPKAVMTPRRAVAGAGPDTPWDRTMVYEAHVRGLTKLHPGVPETLRGTYLGLAQPAVLDHLVSLGITAVELMPVGRLPRRAAAGPARPVQLLGLQSIRLHGAPSRALPCGDPMAEFGAMVAALHDAGIEVILDVVLNHTAESDDLGPTLSFRGLDNASYYRLDPADPRRYLDWTRLRQHARPRRTRASCSWPWTPAPLGRRCGVDGFRFDLAPTLGRDRDGGFDPDAPLLAGDRAGSGAGASSS